MPQGKCVMRVAGLAPSRAALRAAGALHYRDFVGQYLEWYDPNREDTEDLAKFTSYAHKAMVFDSANEALQCYQRVREVDPVRPDGKPNKPLTIFHMVIVSLDDALGGRGTLGSGGADAP